MAGEYSLSEILVRTYVSFRISKIVSKLFVQRPCVRMIEVSLTSCTLAFDYSMNCFQKKKNKNIQACINGDYRLRLSVGSFMVLAESTQLHARWGGGGDTKIAG